MSIEFEPGPQGNQTHWKPDPVKQRKALKAALDDEVCHLATFGKTALLAVKIFECSHSVELLTGKLRDSILADEIRVKLEGGDEIS